MTADRELLELAAKAAGHAIDQIDAMHDPEDWACWNPLEDDGDALRLAVALGINISPVVLSDPHRTVVGYVLPGRERKVGTVEFIHGDDPYAATRRAIVRAAAEIGRAMP